MNLEIILNVIIGMFVYNFLIKGISLSILKLLISDKDKQYIRKSFKERLEEKMSESSKN